MKIITLAALLIILFITFPLAAACQHDYYIPKPVLIPLHSQKQQLHSSVGLGGGIDVNLSYSLLDHIAVFATSSINKGKRRTTSLFGDKISKYKNDNAFTIGGGYFRKKRKRIHELYFGYGNYNVKNYEYFSDAIDLGIQHTEAGYSNIFGQFNIGTIIGKNAFTYSTRMSYSFYNKFLFYETTDLTLSSGRYSHVTSFNIDPAIDFLIKTNALFINLQGGLSVPLSKSQVTKYDLGTSTNPVQTEFQTSEVLISFFGRIALQYKLELHKKAKNIPE
jgi:hypothetical protein